MSQKQKLSPLNWTPYYLYFWIWLVPGEEPYGHFAGCWLPPDQVEPARLKEVELVKKLKKRDDVDVLCYYIREVELELGCQQCGHIWEETHDKVIREFHCPQCWHFNSLKYDDRLHCKEKPSMKERYKAFTLEQWEEYERYWREREGKPRSQPIKTEILEQVKKAAKKKKEQPKRPIFEQLELFPNLNL